MEEKIICILNKRNIKFNDEMWAKSSIGVMAISIIMLFMYNFFFDPYFYFGNGRKDIWSTKIKARFATERTYDCYVIGGSNAGAIDPETVKKYTGYDTFNFSMDTGNFETYYKNIQYVIDNSDVKCIILHLSSTEVIKTKDEIPEYPAILTSDKVDDVKQTYEYLIKGFHKKQVYNHYVKLNGQLDWSVFIKEYNENPEAYITSHVLYKLNDYSSIEDIDLNSDIVENCLSGLQSIKDLCDTNNVELKVLMGPGFIAKHIRYEGLDFYNYLRKLVEITDVYDFSGISDISFNPYNFYDSDHYSYAVADMMIKEIFDANNQDNKGILLTTDNIDDYLRIRSNKWNDLKQVYSGIDSIKYGTLDEDSYICE